MLQLIKNFFQPNKLWGFIFFNLGMILLIYVFSFHLENSFIAYIAYILSFYALVIFCIWFYKVFKASKKIVQKNKLYQAYKNPTFNKAKVSLLSSFCLNLLYGILKLSLGLYYKSKWFITIASYYLLLCFIKGSLALNMKDITLIKEYQKLKHTGVILLFLDIILSGMIILIIHQNQIISYPGYFIYMVALYDFYLIISAFIKTFKSVKGPRPILMSYKCLNLTVAMVSILSLEVAMIYEFGNNDWHFKTVMTSLTGAVICLINLLMAIFMIIKAQKYLKD